MTQSGPQMVEKEIKYIDGLLEELKPEKCLEWGSGGSTAYYPTKHKHIKEWRAIEHNIKWFVYVLNRMNRVNTTLHFKTKEEYLNVDGEWDFILVDGILRNECLAKAKELIKPNGVILLHDSYRDDYDEGVALYENKEVILKGTGEGVMKQRGLTKLWL